MDPYLGEIRLFAGNFVPKGWALCDGQMLNVQQNNALFAILGFQFGGDGKTTFALPDLRNRVPMHQGAGPGLTPRNFASKGGDANVTLNTDEIPNHSHAANAAGPAAAMDPTGALWANSNSGRGGKNVYSATPSVQMNPQAIGGVGGNQPHNNMQPYLALNFIIAVQGIFPARG